MPTLRRRTTHVQETTEATVAVTRSVTVVDESEDDAQTIVYAHALLPDGALVDPAAWRAQRAAQVGRALAFLAVRADGWRPVPTKAGEPRKLRFKRDGTLVDPAALFAPSSPVGDDTLRCAANILRALPDAPMIEQRHGRLP